MDVAYWYDIEQADLDKTIILDVTEPYERSFGFIEGSVNIPLGEIRERFTELSRDKEIIVSCQVGLRAYIASKILKQKGFKNVRVLTGGYRHYRTAMKSKNTLNI